MKKDWLYLLVGQSYKSLAILMQSLAFQSMQILVWFRVENQLYKCLLKAKMQMFSQGAIIYIFYFVMPLSWGLFTILLKVEYNRTRLIKMKEVIIRQQRDIQHWEKTVKTCLFNIFFCIYNMIQYSTNRGICFLSTFGESYHFLAVEFGPSKQVPCFWGSGKQQAGLYCFWVSPELRTKQ